MDKINQYRNIANDVIHSIYERYHDASDIYQIIIDEKNGHYILYRNSWLEDSYRLYGAIVHIEVKANGKIWLHHDGTELIIADWLLDRGVNNKDLVLGFHPPIVRADTEFAVG